MKLEVFSADFPKNAVNISFRENPSSGTRVGQTDRQDEAKAGDTLSSRHVLRFIFNSFLISSHALALIC
jgi:hypothetical protein